MTLKKATLIVAIFAAISAISLIVNSLLLGELVGNNL